MGEGREGDWECGSCTNRNYAFRSFCNHCKQPRILVDNKTPADSKWLPRIGDWICSVLDASLCTIDGGKFHGSTGDTLEYIVKQSNVTVDNLRNVSNYLSQLKRVGVVRFSWVPMSDQRLMRLCLIPIVTVMLLLTFLGFSLVVIGRVLVAAHLSCAEYFSFSIRPPLYYNRSGSSWFPYSQPFSCGLDRSGCASGEVEFSNATRKPRNPRTREGKWRPSIETLFAFLQCPAKLCLSFSSPMCNDKGHLTPDYYDRMGGAVNVSYGLYNYGPFLVHLEDRGFCEGRFT
ncbi:hypothetical protein IFM89_029093 [Coptis chinensis]|uniref:RanBP2-type domain-containing protein n=1 Tax=Coptis chinensis TaxID=261450 RepID=A0A835IH31_9MAGN|nr:hypothetical protein IFM89_029093 [Coptis chinensis]